MDWHTLTPQDTITRLETGPDGLSAEQAAQRLAQYGPNRLGTVKKRGPLLRLLHQFHNILLYVMMASAVVTALLGHWIDTGVLLGAVVINALIGFIQEGKAESAMDAIRAMLSPHATVMRDGQKHDIDATELVPGDVVLLSSGDRVPADLRLFAAQTLRVEEAALTGESLPVDKQEDPVERDAPLGDRYGMAFAGTVVVHGQARGVVVATGEQTEIGKINELIGGIPHMSTPLLRQIDRFGRRLAIVILAAAALTFVLGVLLRGQSMAEMFMMVVALTASAIPEGLPAIMTVTLALGVQRMARRHAIVRRLPAVETLGSVTTICSDKTGTLTRNEMTVQRVAQADQAFHVEGVGYTPVGSFRLGDHATHALQHPTLQLMLRAAVLCNDARLLSREDAWQIQGDPTEGALLVMARKADMDADTLAREWPRLSAIPFESEHRFMATHHQDADTGHWIFMKGAPEKILEVCDAELDRQCTPQPLQIDEWRRKGNDLAANGLRVLALACKRTAPAGGQLAFSDAESGYAMLGLVGIVDPPREEAIAAVAECHQAGIRVKMITGDHVETARAIGAQLGIGVGRPGITGAEIAVLDDAGLMRVAGEVDVFARASPEHKLRLVQALQASGQVVAMTGDGVNDAPALKRADVGVAMGHKGTEAAKEASDVVLADDNFATIASAVREGRAVYDNIRKFILFMLPTNGGEALVVIAAILFGLSLPMSPAQILWINLVTSSTLGLALAFEPAERGIMLRRPRPPSEPLLTGFFAWRVVMVSFLMMSASLGLFLWELERGASMAVAQTMAVNAVVVCEMFYLVNSRHIFHPVANRDGLLGNPYVLVAIGVCVVLQLAFTHTPWMHAVFGSAHLGAAEWGRVIAAGMTVFMVAETEKWIMRRTGWSRRFVGEGEAQGVL